MAMLTLTNARLFDGQRMLSGRHSVVLEEGRIKSIDHSGESGNGVDLDGMTLMPGLITCHMHPDFYLFKLKDAIAGEQLGKEWPPGVLMAVGVRTCRVLLESGFTGYVGAACSHNIDAQLKMAIRLGIIPGPRIRACSHHINTTADANDSLKWWRRDPVPGIDLFADGPEGLRKLVREEIRCGAEMIKIYPSSGHLIPGHRGVRNMARDEIAAVVGAAHGRGVPVRAHVCSRDLILECVELGVDVIDHADEIDETCIEAMARAGSFWVPSFTFTKLLLDIGGFDGDGAFSRSYDQVRRMLPVAQRAGVRILVGDDYSSLVSEVWKDDPLGHEVGCYGREFGLYGEIPGLAPADILSWGAKNAGELLSMGSQEKVGVIAPGAVADLIVVDGDPAADLTMLARPNESLKAVIRDGAFVIDRLSANKLRQAA